MERRREVQFPRRSSLFIEAMKNKDESILRRKHASDRSNDLGERDEQVWQGRCEVVFSASHTSVALTTRRPPPVSKNVDARMQMLWSIKKIAYRLEQ